MRQAIAYVRVSTEKQGASGAGIDAQRAQIEAYAKLRGYRVRRYYTEVASGRPDKLTGRPELTAVLREARAKKCIVLIASMDRFTRSVPLFEELLARKVVKIEVANLGPEANTITLQSAAGRAQVEGEFIGERTRRALAQAKRSGKILGNRTNLPAARLKGTAENARVAAIRLKELIDHIAAARVAGASTAPEIAVYLNQEGIPTARGGLWTAANVHRVVRHERHVSVPSSVPVIVEPIFAVDGRLTKAGDDRLEAALKRRRIKLGQLMREIGYSAHDISIRWRISDREKARKIEAWIEANEA